MSSGPAAVTRPRARARSGVPLAARTEALLFLGALSLVVAAIHAVAAVPHMSGYPLYGGLFIALAVFQAAWGLRVYGHPERPLLRVAVLVNLAVVILWIASRTIGLPLSPDGPGVSEPIGFADLAATIDEVALIALALDLGRSSPALADGLRPAARQVLLVLLILGAIGAMAVGHSH